MLSASNIKSAAKYAAAVLCLGCVGLMTYDGHKARLDIEATKDRVDATTGAVRSLEATVNPKAQHVICKAHGDKPEQDLGIPHDCQDGQCVTWKGAELNLQAAGARCEKGTL